VNTRLLPVRTDTPYACLDGETRSELEEVFRAMPEAEHHFSSGSPARIAQSLVMLRQAGHDKLAWHIEMCLPYKYTQ
jgi:hypothetical protein